MSDARTGLSRELRPSFLGFSSPVRMRYDVFLRVPAFFSLSFQVVNHLATLAVGIFSTFTLCGSIGGSPVFFWPFRQRSRWSRFFLSHFLSSDHHPVDLKGHDCYCCFCYYCYLALFLDFIWLPRKTLFGSANHPLIPIIVLLDRGLVSFVDDSRAPVAFWMEGPAWVLLMDESSWLLLVYMTRSLSSVSSLYGGAAPISDAIFIGPESDHWQCLSVTP